MMNEHHRRRLHRLTHLAELLTPKGGVLGFRAIGNAVPMADVPELLNADDPKLTPEARAAFARLSGWDFNALLGTMRRDLAAAIPEDLRDFFERFAASHEWTLEQASDDAVEAALFDLENSLLRLIASAHTEKLAPTRRGRKTQNRNRTKRAVDRWRPWHARWLELRGEYGPDKARTIVGAEIKQSKTWWGKKGGPSESTLWRNLR